MLADVESPESKKYFLHARGYFSRVYHRWRKQKSHIFNTDNFQNWWWGGPRSNAMMARGSKRAFRKRAISRLLELGGGGQGNLSFFEPCPLFVKILSVQLFPHQWCCSCETWRISKFPCHTIKLNLENFALFWVHHLDSTKVLQVGPHYLQQKVKNFQSSKC